MFVVTWTENCKKSVILKIANKQRLFYLNRNPSVVLRKSAVVDAVVEVNWFSLCLYSFTLNLGRFDELYFSLFLFLTDLVVFVPSFVVVVIGAVVARSSLFSNNIGVVITSDGETEVKIFSWNEVELMFCLELFLII